MTNFKVEQHNIVSKNRLELGVKETWVQSRGFFRTTSKGQEPECIILNAPFIQEGTIIEIWNSGSSNLPTVPMGGKAITPDGKTYHLSGYRDVGIHTGHPPILRPQMKQKWTLENVFVDSPIELWEKDGKFYRQKNLYSAIGDEVNNQTLKEFDISSVDYPHELTKYEFYLEYQRVNLWKTEKRIEMRDTNEYRLID
jgi:hypothetical protein